MKTTKDQQERTRQALLKAAAELMVSQGFDGTSMKQIARAAGIGDATIYQYFPTKEHLLLGFMAQQVNAALTQWRSTPDLPDFDLQENLQSLLDALLAQLMPEREFVALIVERLHNGWLTSAWAQPMPGRAALAEAFSTLLVNAQARGEIPPIAFASSAGALLADFTLGVVVFWLRDRSPHFGDTTRLVDLSLDLLVLVLRTGLVSKLLELGGFVLRSQMARLMQPGNQALDWLHLARNGLRAAAEAGQHTHPRGTRKPADPATDPPAAQAKPAAAASRPRTPRTSRKEAR